MHHNWGHDMRRKEDRTNRILDLLDESDDVQAVYTNLEESED